MIIVYSYLVIGNCKTTKYGNMDIIVTLKKINLQKNMWKIDISGENSFALNLKHENNVLVPNRINST